MLVASMLYTTFLYLLIVHHPFSTSKTGALIPLQFSSIYERIVDISMFRAFLVSGNVECLPIGFVQRKILLQARRKIRLYARQLISYPNFNKLEIQTYI